jgi:hypothetical protein
VKERHLLQKTFQEGERALLQALGSSSEAYADTSGMEVRAPLIGHSDLPKPKTPLAVDITSSTKYSMSLVN